MIDVSCAIYGERYHADDAHEGRSLRCWKCAGIVPIERSPLVIAVSSPTTTTTSNRQARKAPTRTSSKRRLWLTVASVIALVVGGIDACTIRLDPGTTKNQDGRVVTIVRGSTLHELLKACVVHKSADDFVFTRPNKKPIRDFRVVWARCCTDAGKPGLLFHDLRRTAARNLRRAGIAEGIIMAIGGWRTRSVFERYALVREGDISDAIGQLETYRVDQRAKAEENQNGHTSGKPRLWKSKRAES